MLRRLGCVDNLPALSPRTPLHLLSSRAVVAPLVAPCPVRAVEHEDLQLVDSLSDSYFDLCEGNVPDAGRPLFPRASAARAVNSNGRTSLRRGLRLRFKTLFSRRVHRQ
jgi:hypothetical protein